MPPSIPDSKVLGQLLVMQNCVPLLDSEQKLFALVNRGLSRVPGIASSSVALAGDPPSERKPGGPARRQLPIETLQARFGSLELELDDAEQFVPYEPFIRNLAGVIALWLENRAKHRQLEAAVREREALLAVVSHDLSNPLGVIVNMAQLLKDMGEQGSQVTTAANLIERSAKRMSRLVHDLLDLASIDAGHFSVVRGSQDVGRLVSDAVEEFRPAAADKGIALHQKLEGELVDVACDGQRVAQVLSNLIGNAIKFTAQGGTVSVSAEGRGEVRVTVADTGPGISAEDLPHVFDRFYRAKDAASPGTGLGLAIAKEIISLHGGSITVESQRGVGTSVSFTLPAALAADAAAPRQVQA